MRAYIGAFDLILFPRSLLTMTTSMRPARRRNGMASRIARAAARPPSQQTISKSSLSGSFWMQGTTISGLPESNSAASIMFSSTAFALLLRLPDNGEIEAPRDLANWSPALIKLH